LEGKKLRHAQEESWNVGPATSVETGYDLRQHGDVKKAVELTLNEQPELVMAFPCKAWSALQDLAKNHAFSESSSTVGQDARVSKNIFIGLRPRAADIHWRPPLEI
jgi:hypothetical protein